MPLDNFDIVVSGFPGPKGPKGDAGERPVYATWAALAGVTGSAGASAEVPSTDTGTHTDPVTAATVNNSGIFSWSSAPAGWTRISDVDALAAKPYADAAAASATAAGNSAASAAAASNLLEYGVHVQSDAGVQNGLYLASSDTRPVTIGRFYAKLLKGSGTASATVIADSKVIYGPVSFGADGFLATGLAVAVPDGATVEIQISGVNDTMTEIVCSMRATA